MSYVSGGLVEEFDASQFAQQNRIALSDNANDDINALATDYQ
jgi:hypothetical protein